MLVHDDDLGTIAGLGHDSVSGLLNNNHIVPLCRQSIETLEPDVMTDLLRRSNIKIKKVWCGELNRDIITTLFLTRALTPEDSLTGRVTNTDTAVAVVKVAMLSMASSQNRSR